MRIIKTIKIKTTSTEVTTITTETTSRTAIVILLLFEEHHIQQESSSEKKNTLMKSGIRREINSECISISELYITKRSQTIQADEAKYPIFS